MGCHSDLETGQEVGMGSDESAQGVFQLEQFDGKWIGLLSEIHNTKHALDIGHCQYTPPVVRIRDRSRRAVVRPYPYGRARDVVVSIRTQKGTAGRGKVGEP